MKLLKKLAVMVIAAMAAMLLAVPAFAANATISVAADDDRTYEVYQIFTGDLSDGVLSNVKWGENGTGAEGDAVEKDALADLEAVNGKPDTEKLAEISNYVNLDSTPVGEISKGESLEVDTGYYLIKDVTKIGEGEELSLFVVKLINFTTIDPKAGTGVISEKKVMDDDAAGWQDSADYDVNGVVPFQLKGTVTDNYDKYTSYYYCFHDALDSGLTFDEGSVVVKVDGAKITEGYEVVTEDLADGCTFEVRFADLKAIDAVKAASAITVEYTATLNANAVIGSAGNSNNMRLEYSNNPNSGGTGFTANDEVTVFTYRLVVNKVDGDGKPLTGAGFTLYKKANGVYEPVGKEITGVTTFEWKGLDAGNYKLVETTTPAGYNTIDPVEFAISATHDILSDDPALSELTVNVTKGTAEFTPNETDGSLTANIVNQAGTVLPETGGMGTTVLYAAGAILILGAGIALVVRKRVRNN